jgi:putative flavoprotein involved in K+ transport
VPGTLDVVVVGGGQAGLAIGYHLARRGLRFVILEAGPGVGAAWRGRWDSLLLFTPRRYDSLPGLPFPGDPDGYPGRDEVVDYLEAYVEAFDLPVRLNSRVDSVASPNGGFQLRLDAGDVVTADQVVVTTGPFTTPFVPAFADGLSGSVVQMHSTGYRNPKVVPAGTVLVVGGGNTGYQIAGELARQGRDVHLSIGSRQTPLPQRVLGRDLFWWLTKLGVFGKTVETRLGRRLRERLPLIGESPRKAQRAGVTLRARATAAEGRTVRFADGTELDVDAVIWATGYRPDYGWIHADVADDRGRPVHRRGVTAVPGLYFLGLEWQWTRGSALLGWVKDDAAYVAEQVAAYAARHSTSQVPHEPAARRRS